MSKIMETNYSKSVNQKKIKMKNKQHKNNDKEIKETEKEIENNLNDLYVFFKALFKMKKNYINILFLDRMAQIRCFLTSEYSSW